MFNAMKILVGKDITKLNFIENNKIFILIRWLSFNPNNEKICTLIDKYQGKMDPDIIKFILFHKVQKGQITKFFKKTKQDKELDNYIRAYYKLSSSEFEKQKHLVNPEDAELLKKLSTRFGWDKKTCKKFKVEWSEPKKEKLKKVEKPQGKSLFSF